jgi:hypothetical protein
MARIPELLDTTTNEQHRSYLAAVEGQQLHELRPRVAKELLHLDDRWLTCKIFNLLLYISVYAKY